MKETIRRLYKPFILIFLVSLLIINWHDISFIFNYHFISGQLSNWWEVIKPAQAELTDNDYFIKEGFIEIPKIGVTAPIIFAKNKEKEVFDKALRKGVVHYPDSALPGKKGQVVILGHSAPAGWPNINYDNVFTKIDTLEKGDEVFIQFGDQEYLYKVTKKRLLAVGEKIPSSLLTNFRYSLILISCWPPGTNQKRIAMKAEMVNY